MPCPPAIKRVPAVDEAVLGQLHYELIRGLLQRSACPTNSELAATVGRSESDVQSLLRDPGAIHGVVLHPHVCEPWILHPFSLTPALDWIAGETGSWWALRLWCALGVAVLAGGRTRVHTRLGAEAEPPVLKVIDSEPEDGSDVWVHFAIPPARAWERPSALFTGSALLRFRPGVNVTAAPWGKRFLWIRLFALRAPGTATTRIRGGGNGRWRKRRASLSRWGLHRRSGVWNREPGSSDAPCAARRAGATMATCP
jgi:hypothetical protein